MLKELFGWLKLGRGKLTCEKFTDTWLLCGVIFIAEEADISLKALQEITFIW